MNPWVPSKILFGVTWNYLWLRFISLLFYLEKCIVNEEENGSVRQKHSAIMVKLESNHKYAKTSRSVQNVSHHFEYLENQLRSFCVIWKPTKEDVTAHTWTNISLLLFRWWWDNIEWSFLLCKRCIHNVRASRFLVYSLLSFRKKKSPHHLRSVSPPPPYPKFGCQWLLAFRKPKIANETLWTRIKRKRRCCRWRSQNRTLLFGKVEAMLRLASKI